jgi:tRNA modification GTPase
MDHHVLPESDTIVALATPLGRGGIAVIRISGPLTLDILSDTIENCPKKWVPRHAYHSHVIDKAKRIDECVLTYFKGPNSYTGEDVAEISIHSNPFLIEEILGVLVQASGSPEDIRTALPGEFTYRAFKNGKLDLLQAEAVNELINANSRYYAHMTFGSLEGRLSSFMKELKEDLIQLGVRIETKIEFEEDQFFDEISIIDELDAPLKKLDAMLAGARFNELLNKGLSVVIVGKVNVGKSSLFNTLLMEERSIISDIPGTTRDFIREKLYIDGFPIEIVDVAGVNRNTRDSIEAMGIRRSFERLENCDAAILMLDGSVPLESSDKELYRRIKNKKKLVVINKLDKQNQELPPELVSFFKEESVTGVSVKNHINIDSISGFLKELVIDVKGKEAEFTINNRQRVALDQLKELLERVRGMVEARTAEVELIAEEIRGAIDIIGQLMGEITPDDILNNIFSQFCVGK